MRAKAGKVMTYADIAQKVGYGHRQSAYRAVRRELAAIAAERRKDAQELLDAELAELDALLEVARDALKAAKKSDPKALLDAIESVRKLLADRRKFLGSDAPAKQETTVRTETVDPEELRKLLLPLGWDLVRVGKETG